MARFMQWLGVGIGLVLSAGIGLGAGCAAGSNSRPDGEGGAGGVGGTGSGNGSPASSSTGISGCAKFTAAAKQAPAAMLTVLDASASMNKQSKWGQAQLAIKTAIDKDVFDTMSLGLTIFPANLTDPPPCICEPLGLDPATCKALLGGGVSCGVSFLPQVPMALAGMDKTNGATGVRRQMYDWLVGHPPLSNQDDGSPIYDALKAGYDTLKSEPIERRILMLITDGGFSCTSVASPPRAGYLDLNGCPDWEYPDAVNALITAARKDAAKPIYTFIVGVPGSNSVGQKVDGFDTAPYNMQLALSTYAVNGSPDTIDPACTKDAMFTQGGAAPAKPCHIDLSNGASFNADALAKAISDVRGKALGCVYDLPAPPPGEMIDTTLVNVDLTLDGMAVSLKKRKDGLDACALDGCWDYTPDGKLEILGQACQDLGEATAAQVDIVVGCATVLK